MPTDIDKAYIKHLENTHIYTHTHRYTSVYIYIYIYIYISYLYITSIIKNNIIIYKNTYIIIIIITGTCYIILYIK